MLSLVLAGCGGEQYQDLREFVHNAGNGMRGRVEPLPEVKPYQAFTYNDFDLPDPFKPRKVEAAKGGGSGLHPDFNRRKEPLEAYPLDNLKMVGTLEQNKVMYALIKTPDKTLYRVKVGNYMGQNFGKISEITESLVTLKELVQDPTGDWTEHTSTLHLQEEQEQGK